MLGLLAVAGALLWVWTWLSFKPVEHRSAPAADGQVEAPLRDILGHSGFWISTLLAALSLTEAVCFVSGSSMVLPKHFGASPGMLGWTLTICSGCFLLSTLACQWMLKRWGGRAALRVSVITSLLGASLFYTSTTLQGQAALYCLIAAQMTFMAGHGTNQICGQAAAVAPFPDHAGLAAAWSGTIMLLIGVAFGQAQSVWISTDLGRMPWVLVLIAVLTAVLAALQSQREASHGSAQSKA